MVPRPSWMRGGRVAEELQQILTPDGELTGEPPIGIEETRRLYRSMVGARLFDRKGSALQKQGRLATYAPFEGQEAAQIGSAAALRPNDWMVATYRDAAAMWLHGYPWKLLLLWRAGDERGNCPPEGVNALPPSITVGAHMLHAVGLAWAARLQRQDRVAITYFGDGATSEGDFHEAMNFAGVYQLPVLFLCENNQYAISLRPPSPARPRGTDSPVSWSTGTTCSPCTGPRPRPWTGRARGAGQP